MKNRKNKVVDSDHLKLSQIVKDVHKRLRENSKLLGAQKAWTNHCLDKDILTKYAEAMKELATKHWENNYKTNNKAVSRIKWVVDYCKCYFFEGELSRQRSREIEIIQKIGSKNDSSTNITDICFLNDNVIKLSINESDIFPPYDKLEKVKLLDVGSCYNPFIAYDCFEVIAIDIAPANCEVKTCDFLEVNITNNEVDHTKNSITDMQSCSFHVIVFSLFLEYFPSYEQRLNCCVNAYKLLKYEGILIIITPDSKHVGSNSKIMKSWRFILAKIGFSRIKYEKLPYLHCMTFRKSINKSVAKRWAEIKNSEEFYDNMYIPQDFCNKEEK